MKRKKFWYFEIEHKNGKREIVCYGDETKYTQDQAIKLMKALCENRGEKYIGVYEDK